MPRTTVTVYPSGTVLGKRSTNQRRDDQNSQVATLGTLLPFPEDSAPTKDKISVIRLTSAYLKFQKFLRDAGILPPEKSLDAATDNDQEHSNPSSVKSQSSVKSLSSVKSPSSVTSSKSNNSHIFSSLMSKALDGFLMTLDHMGMVLFVSDDSGDYVGLTPPQIIGHTIYEVCDDDSQATIKKNLKLNNGDLIEGNQVWRQFCVRMRSSVSAARTQLSTFYRFNMVHVSGFLKVALRDDGGFYGNDLNCVVVSPSNMDSYRVIGLVAECHLIESPVIMELTIEHSTFTAVASMDMKFTSVDTRVKQIVGFDAEEMIGQAVMDFFHPKEMSDNGCEHTKCRKTLMLQGRVVSPVYRFLTKCGEWIWMQMCVTLLYIPNTKTPYASTITFRVINKDSGDKAGYKLIEHKENFVMDSNSCLPDGVKPHFPEPRGAMKVQPDENQIMNGLHPLSEDAREAFFQARNMGLDTYTTGIQPAMLEDGTEPVKMIPDYTENATLEDIFVPSTMNNNITVPFGPELYLPPVATNNNGTTEYPAVQPLSRVPSAADSGVTISSDITDHNHHQGQVQATYSPSSGYQSSPNTHSTSPESNLLELLSPEQLSNADFEELINALSSPPQKETEPLKKPLNQADPTFDGILDELLMENLLSNSDTFPDLPVYDQFVYHNHNNH